MDDLARRRGDVAPQFELAAVGVAQLPLLHVGQHMLEALDQILAAALDRLLHHGRVGEREIGGRHRVQHAAGGKAQLGFRLGINAIHRVRQAEHIIRGQQIALPDQVVKGMLRPRRIGEPPILGGSRAVGRRRVGLVAQQSARIQETLPQRQPFVGEAGLDARHGFRVERQHPPGRARGLFQHQLLGAADDLGPLLHLLQCGQVGFHDIGFIHGHLAPPGIAHIRRFFWRVATGRVIARL